MNILIIWCISNEQHHASNYYFYIYLTATSHKESIYQSDFSVSFSTFRQKLRDYNYSFKCIISALKTSFIFFATNENWTRYLPHNSRRCFQLNYDPPILTSNDGMYNVIQITYKFINLNGTVVVANKFIAWVSTWDWIHSCCNTCLTFCKRCFECIGYAWSENIFTRPPQ